MCRTIKFDYCLLFLFLSLSDVSIDIYCSLDGVAFVYITHIHYICLAHSTSHDWRPSVVKPKRHKFLFSRKTKETFEGGLET